MNHLKHLKKYKMCEKESIPEGLLEQLLCDDLGDDVYGQLESDLMNNRMLYLDDVVDKNLVKIAKAIMYWNEKDKEIPIEDRTPIKLYICSPGGDMNYMWMLVDIMLASKTPIFTIGIGVANSAAAILFLSASKRFMFPHATLMIHQGSAELSGDYGKIQSAIKNYSNQVTQMYHFIKKRCAIADESLNQHLSDDWYLDAEECKQHGICHQIIETLDDIK